MNEEEAIKRANQIVEQYNDLLGPKKILCAYCNHEIDATDKTPWLHKTKNGLSQKCECGCIKPEIKIRHISFLAKVLLNDRA